ncbi:TPA: hypothetical protein I7730_01440 [Vibrio vulnificus]|uniref:Uncharacterized protein n=1 Tax=Vibrio vulnificus TaxID=672 RepID=A0A8H9K5G6_VIBVL|nr:hypothetical protein [Vibrio vulnificus]HAS8538460.1 hypothetical protein [Vibrio vulnificus]
MKPEIIEQIRSFVVETATELKKNPELQKDIDDGNFPRLVIENALELPIENKLLIEIRNDFEIGFYLTEVLPHKPEVDDIYLARIWAELNNDTNKPSFSVRWSFDCSWTGLNIENKYWEDVFNSKMVTQIEVSKWILCVVNGFRNRTDHNGYNFTF